MYMVAGMYADTEVEAVVQEYLHGEPLQRKTHLPQ